MVSWLIIWKSLRVLIYLSTAVSIIIFPLLDSVAVGTKTGNWRPLAKATGGLVFAADQEIKLDVELLTNTTLREEFPEKFDVKFVSSVKADILTNLAILVVMGLLIFVILMKIAGNAAEHLGLQITLAVIAVVILALLEFGWLAAFEGTVQIPFQGLWNLIANYQFILQVGEDVVVVTAQTTIQNVTTAVNETINSTINTTL